MVTERPSDNDIGNSNADIRDLVLQYQKSTLYEQLKEQVKIPSLTSFDFDMYVCSINSRVFKKREEHRVSWFYQFWVLLKRTLVSNVRNPSGNGGWGYF